MDRELSLRGLEKLIEIREIEEHIRKEFFDQKIFSFLHLMIGQEASPVGISLALAANDIVMGNHRSHGHYLAKTRDFKGLAAEILLKEGINAEVIDLRTLKPLDKDTIISSVKKTSKCVIVEQGWSQSGIGSEITAILMEEAFDYLDAPVLRVTGKDVPMPYAENLEKLALPTVEDILDIVKKII